MRVLCVLGLTLVLGGCVTWVDKLGPALEQGDNRAAVRTAFTHCFGHGCTDKAETGFSDAEWARVRAVFASEQALSAAEERARLRLAIALMETVIGEKTGTSADVGGSFNGFGQRKQQDCVDEMINTATYVKLLIDEGLVVQHDLGVRLTNDFFNNNSLWPHTAMTIRERTSGEEWAIDSWWLKNGSLPFIVTRKQWSTATWDRPRSDEAKAAAEAASDAILAGEARL